MTTMSNFSHGFKHGLFYGMFKKMFCNFGMLNLNYCNSFEYQMPPPVLPPMPQTQITWSTIPIFDCNSANYTQNNFNTNNQIFSYSTSNIEASPVLSDTFIKSESDSDKKKQNKTVPTDEDFDKMLKFVLESEGGYVANDCGQACNKGIQQNTYDTYRTRKGLAKNDVKNITDEEVREIYYTMYYKASGADKISDKKLAFYLFDAAVNMGVNGAKKILANCDNNAELFMKKRLEKYNIIAENHNNKRIYLRGWESRINRAKTFAGKEFIA